MKRAKTTILTALFLGLILAISPAAPAQFYRPFFVWTSAALQDETGYLLRGTNPMREGWDGRVGDLLQVINVGGDGEINPPDPSGQPTGDDTVLTSTHIGIGVRHSAQDTGRFCFQVGRPPETDIYARVFNASTLEEATFYGDSTVFPFFDSRSKDFAVDDFELTAADQPLDTADDDGDGLNNSWEKSRGTAVDDPDSDADGLLDGEEASGHTLPANRGTLGYPEVPDLAFPQTDPLKPDTDGDGLTDYEEVIIYGTDPTKIDSDGDGYTDKEEIDAGSDPNDPDSYPGAAASPTPTPPPTPEPTSTPGPSSSPTPTPETTPFFLILESGDYDGDNASDIALYRPSLGLWAVRGLTRLYFGAGSDIPTSGDYNGDGTTETAVFRPSIGLWAIRGITRTYFGREGDIPIPAAYAQEGRAEIAVFRPETGLWAGISTRDGEGIVYFGAEGDLPVPEDYDHDGFADIAVFREDSGLWAVRDLTSIYFGGTGDFPAPRDYDGDGSVDIAVFRPASGLWAIRGLSRIYFGGEGDRPLPADYDGDGCCDIGIFRPSSSLWAIRGSTRCYFGDEDAMPVCR